MKSLLLLSSIGLTLASAPACGDEADGSTSGPGAGGTGGTTTSSTGGSTSSTGGSTSSTGGSAGGGGGIVDEAPGPVTDLGATFVTMPHSVDLSWGNPPDADLAGVVVARSSGSVGASEGPVDGATYMAGDTLPGGAVVVASALGTMATDAEPTLAGDTTYTAWAVDAANQYGPASETTVTVPLPEQTGTITITGLQATPAATVTTQPSNLTLGATNVTLNGSVLTLELAITNDVTHPLYNAKASVDAVGQGSVDTTLNTFAGSYQGKPVIWYGPEAIGAAGTGTRTLTITGVDGSVDPLVIDLHVLNHPTLIGPSTWGEGCTFLDSSGAQNGVNGDTFGSVISSVSTKYAFGGSDSAYNVGAFSLDGTMLYMGNRQMPRVAVIDMTTSPPSVVAGADLSMGQTDIGHIRALAESPDRAFVYAVVITGDHQYPDGGGNVQGNGAPESVELVKLDATTLVDVGRATLVTNAPDEVRGRNVALSADGLTAVVGVGATESSLGTAPEQIFVVDTTAMTATAVDVTSVGARLHSVAIAADGSTAFASFKRGDTDRLAVVDLTSTPSTVTASPSPGIFTSANAWDLGDLLATPAGVLMPTHASLMLYDPVGSTWTTISPDNVPSVGFSGDSSVLYVERNGIDGDIRAYDPGTWMQIDVDGDPANGTDTSLQHQALNWGTHKLILSPY